MMYKQASKLKLRFSTTKGLLNVEQLWNLSLTELDTLAIEFQESYKKSNKKSFLVKKTKKDKDLKLAFDIVLDILNTKVEEAAVLSEASTIKAYNQKILSKIEDAKDKELDGKSIKELEKMLK